MTRPSEKPDPSTVQTYVACYGNGIPELARQAAEQDADAYAPDPEGPDGGA